MIKEFFNFCNQKYLLFATKDKMKDGRKAPQTQILASTIFLSFLLLVIFKKRSILQLDQMMRIEGAINFFNPVKPDPDSNRNSNRSNRSNRRIVASDSTISRSLSSFELSPLRSYLKRIYLKAKSDTDHVEGKCSIEVGNRRMKVASVDGSEFGVFYGSVIQLVGEANLLLDIEVAKNRGKELIASRSLLQRAFEEYGDGFVDISLFDGLYTDQKTINLCLTHQSEVLIKTTEETLLVIQDAKGLFRNYKSFPELEHEAGFDEGRMCQYELFASEGFSFRGVKKPMKVAYVKEYYPKRAEDERNVEFWVLTTDESLTGNQMRELAHLRWRIENNSFKFKQLNAQANCDHVYTHDAHAFEALMLMLFVGFNLLQLFNLGLDLSLKYGQVRVTFDFVSSLLMLSFFALYGFSSDP